MEYNPPNNVVFLQSDGEKTIAILKTECFPCEYFAGRVISPNYPIPLHNATYQWHRTYEEAFAALERRI